MRFVVIALMLLITAASHAASPEDSYIASRDRSVGKVSPGDGRKFPGRILKQEESSRADLEKQLRRIVGPIAIQGFPGEGKSNLDTLFKGDLGFGLLDGLVYASADGKTRVVVTTDALFAKWLRQHRNWWGPKLANVPQSVDAALKSNAFYTQALTGDAAVSQFAVLPIGKPATAKFAFAMLVGRSQDIGLRVPDEIIVSVVQAGKVFVVSAPTSVEVKPIAACDDISTASEKKAEALFKAYSASDLKDQKLFDKYSREQEKGDEAFRRCFAERAGKQSYFAALTAQAQALADLLPER